MTDINIPTGNAWLALGIQDELGGFLDNYHDDGLDDCNNAIDCQSVIDQIEKIETLPAILSLSSAELDQYEIAKENFLDLGNHESPTIRALEHAIKTLGKNPSIDSLHSIEAIQAILNQRGCDTQDNKTLNDDSLVCIIDVAIYG
jgi:hypothetical protein